MLKHMVAKSKKDLQQRHLVEVEGSDALVCPENLRAFADPIKSKMTDIQNQLANGTLHMREIFETLDDSQVSYLKDLFDPEKKDKNKCYSVDRLVLASKVILSDELSQMATTINYVQKLRNDVLSTFVESFAMSYHIEKGNEALYNLKGAHEDLKAIVNYRRGVKKVLEARGLPNEEPEAQSASCAIM